jgi:hypothetical protein
VIRQRKPVPRKRRKPRVVHSERTAHITGHKRVRLTRKADIDKRRAEVFERAGGRCEEILPAIVAPFSRKTLMAARRCPNRATEWSHKKHAANKCDCLSPDCNIASCHECHIKRHNAGGKPCPKKEKVA